MIRIPYPVPEPLRTKLIDAGKVAVAAIEVIEHGNQESLMYWRTAHKAVHDVTNEIILRHGFEE